MKKRLFLFAFAIAGIVLLSGCQENGTDPRNETPVNFNAGSVLDLTRTAYSGVLDDNGIERIDWLVGDMMLLWSDYAVTENTTSPENSAAYRIENETDITEDGHISRARVKPTLGKGLYWPESPTGTYRFWGLYPHGEQDGAGGISDVLTFNKSVSDGVVNYEVSGFKIKNTQIVTASTETKTKQFKVNGTPTDLTLGVYKPDMVQAIQLAMNAAAPYKQDVTLDFYPAFTAFEFNIACRDMEVGLTSATLSYPDGVSGTFAATLAPEAGSTYAVTSGSTGDVTVTFPEGTKISNASGISFTVFALPQDFKKTTAGELTVKFVMNVDGTSRERTLKLNTSTGATGDKYFAACKKHVINGIMVPAGIYILDIGGNPIDWEPFEATTDFSSHVIVEDKFRVGGTGNLETNYNFETGEGYSEPIYNGSVFQTWKYINATLDLGITNAHWEVTFKPTAPHGGYWELLPEGVGCIWEDAFDIQVYDGETLLPGLTGQIMNKTLTIYIYPKASRDPSQSYSLIIPVIFSPNKNMEPAYNVDSEIQSVQSGGIFSYWRFIIPNTD